MYEMIEKKKNDISVYGVKYGDLQIDDISADKDRVKKFVKDVYKRQERMNENSYRKYF